MRYAPRVGIIFILIGLGIGINSCKTTVPGPKALSEELGRPYQGYRSAPPDLLDSEKRLDIFVGVLSEEEIKLNERSNFKEVIYCIAQNEGVKPLPEVFKLINEHPNEKLIYIWGKPLSEKRKWWWSGVTCEAVAIAVWHNKAKKYIYFDLSYRTSIWQWATIQAALRKAVENAAKKAISP